MIHAALEKRKNPAVTRAESREPMRHNCIRAHVMALVDMMSPGVNYMQARRT